jgi:hypothetical protein
MSFIKRNYRITTLVFLGLLLTYISYLQDSIWFLEMKNTAVCSASAIVEKAVSIIG